MRRSCHQRKADKHTPGSTWNGGVLPAFFPNWNKFRIGGATALKCDRMEQIEDLSMNRTAIAVISRPHTDRAVATLSPSSTFHLLSRLFVNPLLLFPRSLGDD